MDYFDIRLGSRITRVHALSIPNSLFVDSEEVPGIELQRFHA